jgi:hypothetical protein
MDTQWQCTEESYKFHKRTSEKTKTKMSKEKLKEIIEEREWNYYFDVGTKVTIDGDTNPPDDPIKSGWDLHAFGQGKSYYMDVEFGGKTYPQISSFYIKEYE